MNDMLFTHKGATTRAYIAGPMRGIPKFNFPAFERAAKYLRGLGYDVWSPAERDVKEDGLNVDTHEDFNTAPHSMSHYMERDLPEVCRADTIAILPGWENSEGALLEVHVARKLGKTIIDAFTTRILGDAALDSAIASAAFGRSVDAALKRETMKLCGQVGAPIGKGHTVTFGIGGAPTRASKIPDDAASRKGYPIASGCIDYFPDALAEIAHLSHVGNEQHNPGSPLHWDREKSGDEADAMMRHFVQRGTVDKDGIRHSAKMAWRALALLQKEVEA